MQYSGFPHWLAKAEAMSAALARFDMAGSVAVLVEENQPPADLPPPLQAEIAAAPRVGREGFLLRRRIARKLVGAITSTAPEALAIDIEPGGAPLVSGARAPIWLSFSGRAGISIVAAGCAPLGVDIEVAVEEALIPVNLLRPDERAALSALPTEARSGHFTDLWAMKEAIAKALHLGFSLEPEAIRIAAPAAPAIRIDGQWRPLTADTALTRIEIRPGAVATLALALLSSPEASAMT